MAGHQLAGIKHDQVVEVGDALVGVCYGGVLGVGEEGGGVAGVGGGDPGLEGEGVGG